MTVSLSFSTVAGAGGTPIALPQSGGTISPGASSTAMDIYIYHDGANEITDVKFYMLPYSAGVYPGTESAQDDYDKVVGWGDTSYPLDPTTGGGVYFNQNLTGSHPAASYQVFRSGVGDTLANAVTLSSLAMYAGNTSGTLEAGDYAHLKFRVDVPSGEGSTGTVYFDILFSYTATS